jgi:TetR/AcrR family transcriptional regulator
MKRPPADLADRLWEHGDTLLAPGENASIDQVATATDIPRATLYYYFSGKDDIVGFLLSQKLERGTKAIADAAAEEGTPPERLEAVLRAALRAMAHHPALCTRLNGYLCSSDVMAEVVMSAEQKILGPVREILIEGRARGEFALEDPQEAATALLGAISQSSMSQILATGRLEAEETGDRLIPLLLHGVLSR